MAEKQSTTTQQVTTTFKNRIKSFIWKNKIDLIFISLIAIFTLMIIYLLINANNQLGIYCTDVFVYLINSLNFAGYSIGSKSTMYLSPVICFLTSLIFRLGFVDQIAIFTVTGLFFPIASIGLYLLCRLHLNKIISLFGTFLFISFSLNILWTSNGTLDIPAIAISIWTLYFYILAIDKNPKYFTIALPLFIIGFFTRYTVGFILPLMILYILFKIDIFDKIKLIFNKKLFIENIKNLFKSKPVKYFIIGLTIAIGILIVILSILLMLGSDLTFINQTQDVISGSKGSEIDPGFKPDPLFYLTNLPNFISSTRIIFDGSIPILQDPSISSYFILGLIIVGFLSYIFKIFTKFIKNKDRTSKNKENKVNARTTSENKNKKDNIRTNNKDKEKKVNSRISKSKEYLIGIAKSNKYLLKFVKLKSMKTEYIKIIGVIILSIVIIATYKNISSVISEILFLVNILLIFNILNKYHFKHLNFNLLMFSWFMVYLIFFSYSDVKVDRYFITVMPVIAYFAAYSLNFLINEINEISFVKNKHFLNLNYLLKQNKKIKENNLTNQIKMDNEKIEKNTQESYKTKNNTNTQESYKTRTKTKTKEEKYTKMNKDSQISFLSGIIPIILVIIFAMSSFTHIETIPTENSVMQDPIKASKWLMNYDPDYESKVIWTHNRRFYSWYLKTDVVAAYEKDLHKLEKNNVTYLIFNNYYPIENYTLIKKYDNIYIYKKNL